MAEIVGSLFGITPDLYQQQQALQADRMALEFAKLDPFESAKFAIGRGAYGLAGALGGALGAQDPQLQLISQRNAISKQINYNDPASIMQGVELLSQGGDTVGAMQLADVARKLQSEMAQTFQRTAAGQASLAQAAREPKQAIPADIAKAQEIGRLTVALQTPDLDESTRASLEAQLASLRPEPKERPGAANIQLANEIRNTQDQIDTLTQQPASPERDAALRRASTYFDALQRQLPQPREAKPQIQTVGVAAGTNKPVYVDPTTDQQFVYEMGADGKQVRKPYVGGVDRTTARVSATSQSIQETEFSKQLGGAQGKRYESAITLRDNAIASLNTFDTLSKLNDQGLISGSFATGRVGATNLLNTLGLVSQETAEKLARSENYQKVAGDAILATLGGKLGVALSNEDRKFIQSLVPQLENSAAARRQLIDYMIAKNRSILGETSRLIDFAETKRTLNGFVPSIPLPGIQGAAVRGTPANPIKLD